MQEAHRGTFRRPEMKQPVDPGRIRQMPRQFAAVDRRLVYDRHTRGMTHQEMALYLFLHCVADPVGISYYSDERICERLHLTATQLRESRQRLVQRQFLLYRKPIYQLLDLPPQESVSPAEKSSVPAKDDRSVNGSVEAVSVADVLNALCAKEFLP